MSRTPVPFAPDTLESIRRAFRVASDRRHDLVSLEHMLHALIEDLQAREILARCRVDLAALKIDLEMAADQRIDVALLGFRDQIIRIRLERIG